MKTINSCVLIFTFVVSLLCFSCSKSDDILEYVGPRMIAKDILSAYADTQIYQQHKNAPLKILAIGNSFTHNAATYLPWLTNQLNGDSICIAKLTRSGCSLNMHWGNHVNDSPDYEFFFSNNGEWVAEDISTIDVALDILDWDIIVIQQASGLSGDYSTYNALPYLVQLFYETNPNAKLAWHYTWPYKEGTNHEDFPRYDNDPQKMYEAILDACDQASEDFDIRIPSATLIWEMRKQYPEVEDKFSTDGYHISSDLALYALSTLWYEFLIAPYMHSSSLNLEKYPDAIGKEEFARAKEIIRQLVDAEENESNSVPMIHTE